MSQIAYFDNAATTFPKPKSVYEYMDSFYRTTGVNMDRGKYALTQGAENITDETRLLLLKLFNSKNKKVVFTPSATEALNVIIQGLPIFDGSNIYVTPFEHNAVTRVLYFLHKSININIIELKVDPKTFSYDLKGIRAQFVHNKPHVVIMSHASNVCGLIAPVFEISNLAKKYDAITVIDMSQTAGLIKSDMSSDNIDFAVFAGHKTLYGPFGIAGFITSGRVKIKPLLYGGTGTDSGNPELPDELPKRYEVGSQNILSIAGLNAALKWIDEVGMLNISKKEKENHQRLLEMFQSFSNIKLIGYNTQVDSIGVVSVIFDGYSPDNIGEVLSQNNVAVRTGLHCAPSAHRFLKTYPAGTVRFSVGFFNNDVDFEILKAALDYIAANS